MKTTIHFFLLFIFSLFISSESFSKKKKDLEDLEEETIEVPTDPKYGPDSAKCVQSNSLFHEFYKQKNYDEAEAPVRWVLENCPAAFKRPFIEGEVIFKKLIVKTKEKERKQELIDYAYGLYDKRIEHFGQKAKVVGRKAIFTASIKKDKELAYSQFKESINLSGRNSDPYVLTVFFQVSISLFEKGKIEKEELFNNFETAYETSVKKSKEAKSEKKRQKYEKYALDLEGLFSPFADCESLEKIFGEKIKEAPKDKELLDKSLKFLTKSECLETELYSTVAKNLYKIEPTPGSAFGMAKIVAKAGKFNEALGYLEKAVELDDNNDRIAGYYYLAAQLSLGGVKSPQKAASYAKRASNLKKDWGEPLLIRGDAIVANISSLSDELEKKASYILAVKYFKKAKRVDPDVSKVANEKIKSYKAYYPENKVLFFNKLKVGDDFKIGGWVNETIQWEVLQ